MARRLIYLDGCRIIQDAVQEQMIEMCTDRISQLNLVEPSGLLCLYKILLLQVLIFLTITK